MGTKENMPLMPCDTREMQEIRGNASPSQKHRRRPLLFRQAEVPWDEICSTVQSNARYLLLFFWCEETE